MSDCWGEFEVSIPYEVDRDQFGALIASVDLEGGRFVREYPIRLTSGT